MIVGESGTGKTYTTQCICAELVQLGVPVIVFDFGQGFSLRNAPQAFAEFGKPLEIHAARDGISINPLQIFSDDLYGPVNVAQRIADTFGRVYSGIGVQQHAVLRDAIIDAFESKGIRPQDPSSWHKKPPTLRDIEDSLHNIATDRTNLARRYANSVSSHISTMFVFNTFRPSGHDLNWSQMIGKKARTNIIQLKGLETQLEKAVTELLLWNFIGFLEDLGPGAMRCALVLDEAHRLSFDESSPVEKLLREGRKFGVSVIVASQQPEDFSTVAFSNTASKLIFSIADPKGNTSRFISQKHMIDSQRLSAGLGKLDRGTALFLSNHFGNTVKVTSFERRVAIWMAHRADQTR